MKTIRRWTMVLATAAALASPARAQVTVVSAKSADGLIGGLRSAVVATGLGEGAAAPVVDFLDGLKAPEALKGIDRARPLGVYFNLPSGPGQQPSAVALVPVSGQADFLALLGRFGAQSRTVQGVAGVTHSITAPDGGMTLFGRFEGGYAVFATHPSGPPADAALKPATVLGKPPGMLAARIALDRLPPEVKAAYFASVNQNVAAEKERKPGEDENTYEARMAGMNLVLDGIAAFVREGRDLGLVLDVDPAGGDLTVELVARPTPNSALATAFKAFGSTASLFRGVGEGSMARASIKVPVSEAIRKAFGRGMARQREDAAKFQGADQALALGFLDVFEPILTGPELDLGASILGPFPEGDGASSIAAVFALKVADGAQADRLFRDLAAKAAKEPAPGVEKITVDAAKADDGTTPIHEVRLAAGNPALARFGEPVIRAAARRDAIVIAVGGQGLAPLKQALAAIAKPPTQAAPQVRATLSLARAALLATDTPRAEADFRGQLKAAGIFQGADATRDTVSLTLGGGESLSIRLRVDGPTLKFLANMGVTMPIGGRPAP